MSTKLRKITANCWLATDNNTPSAVIHRGDDGYLFMTPDHAQRFKSMVDIKTFLGGAVKEHIRAAKDGLNSEVTEHINGFPVKHAKFSVETDGDRPVYVRTNARHVAGYWCIKFSKRWVPSFCPMLKTVEQYQSSGPFKNRLEMMAQMGELNRQL